MNTEQNIIECLKEIKYDVCQIKNFSNQHARGENSHFELTIVSDVFVDLSTLARHRMINKLLLPLLNNPVHAWTLNLYTSEQWKSLPIKRDIPKCHGSVNSHSTAS